MRCFPVNWKAWTVQVVPGDQQYYCPFVPLVMFIFYMLTSGLMFTLLDEKFDTRKMGQIISLSFLPVILNCLIYLIVLYGIDKGGTRQEMLYHSSSIGLSLADMEQVSYIFWVGFYLFLAVRICHEFPISLGKAVAITCIPTLLVVVGRCVFDFF